MRQLNFLVIGFVLSLFVVGGSASATPDRTKLQTLRNFAFGLGGEVLSNSFERLKSYDVVAIDGEGATREQISELHAAGALVLGYLSVGTIEPDRFWYKRAKPFRLDLWEDFGEYFADTSKEGFRELIADVVMPRLLKKGFDGIFLDNVDMIRDHRRQKPGMRKLVRAIAAYVHRRGKYLFAQNGEDVLGPIFLRLDGWNREDVTSTYNFDTNSYERLSSEEIAENVEALRRIKARGIFVTTADYVLPGDSATTEIARLNACSAGAIPFVSTIELNEIPETPIECD